MRKMINVLPLNPPPKGERMRIPLLKGARGRKIKKLRCKKKHLFYIIAILFTACSSPTTVEKPVWTNETAMVDIPLQNVVFQSDVKEWKASLLSFVQPIPLKICYTDSGFSVSQSNENGVIEGPATICLSVGNQHFYYPIEVKNRNTVFINKVDYRSPKTVNTDSVLQHQRTIHAIDEWRNITLAENASSYFFEEDLSLPSKVGVYRAQPENPISAYYVQAGSVVDIPLTASYVEEENVFRVTAGPMKDKYGNTVSDGTSVAFVYTDDSYTYRMESSLLNGWAVAKIPIEGNHSLELFAQVGAVFSDKIRLVMLNE